MGIRRFVRLLFQPDDGRARPKADRGLADKVRDAIGPQGGGSRGGRGTGSAVYKHFERDND